MSPEVAKQGRKRQALLSPAVIYCINEASMVDTRNIHPSCGTTTTLKINHFRVDKPLKQAVYTKSSRDQYIRFQRGVNDRRSLVRR